MVYRDEITGLRALAVIPVVLHHFGFQAFSGGFIGVDLFFIISGYLITSIVSQELATERFSYLEFYERRARRILPALYFVMLFTIPFAYALLMPHELKGFSKSLVATPLFSSNVLFWAEAGYWDSSSDLKPLLHTWSLAIEEQYYIIFPFFFALAWKFKNEHILSIMVAISLGSLLLAHWGAYNKPSATFYLLPTRIWELTLGGIIAIKFGKKSIALNRPKLHILNSSNLYSIIGFLLISYSVFFFDKNTPTPSLHTLIPTIGCALILSFGTKETLVGRILSVKPITFLGLLSFSIYLWHQPILALSKQLYYSNISNAETLSIILIIFFISLFTYRYIEQPFRNREIISRFKILLFSLAGACLFIITGIMGITNNGYPQRNLYTNLKQLSYEPDNAKLRSESWRPLLKYSNGSDYKVINNDFDQELWFSLEENNLQKLLLVGNSHSKDMFNILNNSVNAKNQFEIARFGVQIRDMEASALFESANYAQSDSIMLVSLMNDEDLEELESIVEKIVSDGKDLMLVKNSFTFDNFADRSIADNLYQKLYLDEYLYHGRSASKIVDEINKAYFDDYKESSRKNGNRKADEILNRITEKHENIQILDRMEYACEERSERCFGINTKFEKFYYDGMHNTLEGAKFFGSRVDEINWI